MNAELTEKLQGLEQANDDLLNLMSNIEIATIFLDDRLRVKRFTPQARSVARLIDGDVGRPLADLATLLDYPDLLADAGSVLASLRPVEKQAPRARRRLVHGADPALSHRAQRRRRAGGDLHRHHGDQARGARPGGALAGREHRRRRARAAARPGQRRSGWCARIAPSTARSAWSPRRPTGSWSTSWAVANGASRGCGSSWKRPCATGLPSTTSRSSTSSPTSGEGAWCLSGRPVSMQGDEKPALIVLGIQDAGRGVRWRSAGGSRGMSGRAPSRDGLARSASSPRASWRAAAAIDLEKLTPDEIRGFVHELEVHRVELEIQNEQLAEASSRRRSRRSATASSTSRRRSDTSRSIPTERSSRRISVPPSCWALPRARLLGRKLSSFVAEGHQDRWHFARRALAESGERRSLELELSLDDGSTLDTQLVGSGRPEAGGTLNLALLDVTELRSAERALRRAASAASLAEQQERRKLASDLHDDAGQLLSLASLKLRALADAVTGERRRPVPGAGGDPRGGAPADRVAELPAEPSAAPRRRARGRHADGSPRIWSGATASR